MLDLIEFITTVENLLIKNNTTTSGYYISDNLNKKINGFYKGLSGMHENTPILSSQYPVCFIEIANKTEAFNSMGRPSAKRDAGINFNIIFVTEYGAGTVRADASARETSGLENLQGTQNIENLIRNFPKLSTTSADFDNRVLDCNIQSTDYSIRLNNETYNNVSRISCLAKLLTK